MSFICQCVCVAKKLEAPDITLDSIPTAVLHQYFRESVSTKALDETLLLAIATSLHHTRRPSDGTDEDAQLCLARAVTLHVKQNSSTMPPCPKVYYHLLMAFHRLRAYQDGWDFFRWLSRQEVEYTSPEVYGAGIELVSALNAAPDTIRATITELLDTALDRFPDGFVKYHFQPNARLANRSIVAKQGQESLQLLARATRCFLRHHLIQEGYLGLDTLLRLCPTSTPLIVVSEAVNQRNVFEAYKVLLLRYRNHTGSRHTSPVPLISKINRLLRTDDHIGELQADLRVELITACVTLVRACLASGGSFDAQMCTSVVKALSYVDGSDEALEQRIFPLAHRLVYGFLEQQLPIHRSVTPINALLSVAARMEDKTHFAEICSVLEDAGVTADASTYMTMMGHATEQGNLSAFKLAWEGLRDVEPPGTPASQRHWAWFASRGPSFGEQGRQWAAAQVRQYAAFIPDPVSIQRIVSETPAVTAGTRMVHTRIKRGSATEALNSLVDSLDRLLLDVTKTTQPDFASHQFPMSISPRHEPPIASDDVLRNVYNRLTARSETEVPPESAGPTLHLNGYTVEDLRYENWKTLTELLRFSSIFQVQESQMGQDDDDQLRAITQTLRQIVDTPHLNRVEDVQAHVEQWRCIGKESDEK